MSRFLELLTVQVLQSGSEAPSGLQFHILDLYMAELAGVASAEVRHIHLCYILLYCIRLQTPLSVFANLVIFLIWSLD